MRTAKNIHLPTHPRLTSFQKQAANVDKVFSNDLVQHHTVSGSAPKVVRKLLSSDGAVYIAAAACKVLIEARSMTHHDSVY